MTTNESKDGVARSLSMMVATSLLAATLSSTGSWLVMRSQIATNTEQKQYEWMRDRAEERIRTKRALMSEAIETWSVMLQTAYDLYGPSVEFAERAKRLSSLQNAPDDAPAKINALAHLDDARLRMDRAQSAIYVAMRRMMLMQAQIDPLFGPEVKALANQLTVDASHHFEALAIIDESGNLRDLPSRPPEDSLTTIEQLLKAMTQDIANDPAASFPLNPMPHEKAAPSGGTGVPPSP